MKTLIEINVLQNFSPSNLNRDDTGAPKDALFGGTRRARISSQCMKRAVRKRFQNDALFSLEEQAVRTKRIYQEIAKHLREKHNRDYAESAGKAKIALTYVGLKPVDGDKAQYLLFLGRNEIAALADAIDQYWEKITETVSESSEKGRGRGKKAAAAGAPQAMLDALKKIFNGGKAVDVALFGRMLADMPEKNQDAACQVAHAISTHAVEREFDFYTAVDDLKPEDTPGADMMGTVEFNSACFYRYAIVDWEKFLANLQQDDELAIKGLRAFLESFVVAEPTGKQNTFAAHNPPEFVAISVRHNTAPRNLANAFEVAVRTRKDESITGKSAEALYRKAKLLRDAFGGEEKTYVLNLTGADTKGFGEMVSSLSELLDKSIAAARG